MFSPVLLLQVWKLFKQFTRSAPFDPPHDLSWRQRRRTTGQNMQVILAYHPFYYPDLKGFTGPTYQLSNSLRHFSCQHLVAVLRYPYKMVLNLKNCVTTVSVFHAAPPFVQHIVAAKADRLKPVVLTLGWKINHICCNRLSQATSAIVANRPEEGAVKISAIPHLFQVIQDEAARGRMQRILELSRSTAY
jgi:hypothetical protein